MHLLIIEDDRTIAENIYDYLEARGHQCDYADSIAAASALLARTRVDALVLDRNLSDGDGLALARRLRTEGFATPILVLTARDALEDKLLGFEAGGDDYLVKPFALQELEVRLLALARRNAARPADSLLKHGALSYNAATQALCLHGEPVTLPPKALRLVAELLSQPERVFSRRELEIAVWGHEQDSSDNLRSVLHTLRRALGEDASAQVVNVHGLGYKLVSR
ncbi:MULTISPECIES: response regulator transcription factor [Betaproteobacteria]|uniref:response regulator transcription factor n=1 Tax=Betaproteobacteria TaxID=28216 RepID=UPI000E7D7E11|nr:MULTISPECIES: response regulator transcription factor [Betaproteobacteria]WBL64494.1 response regulator transcription factor [Thauera sp. WB-2]HAY08655.1 DNA-binding response regulator [Thauera sp.]HNR84477.1 response regulator transcription factor [Ottowia sp.]HNS93444.1 response regulator transcription factor [Thauera sp.]